MSERTKQNRAGAGRALCIAIGAGMLPGCTVGPDFHQPESSVPDNFVGASAPRQDAPEPDVARWWTSFSDPQLESLVERALTSNIDLRLAEDRLRQARAARGLAAAGLWPQVNADGEFTRSRVPGPGNSASTGNFFRAGFDATWEIDVFGGLRRGVEAAEADIAAAQEDLRDVHVSVAAEVATTYFDLRGLERRLAVAKENLAAQEHTAVITRQRYEGGFVSGLDAANAEAQAASTRSEIPSLESQAQQARYALAVLLGLEPGALLSELAPGGPLPPTPPEVPPGLPSDLLRRRPDIRRAEAQIHGATARVGVATADLFPKFSLLGSLGLQGSQISALSTAADRFWSFGPTVSWPVFDGNRIRSNIAVQEAIKDQTFDSYRQTVLVALQDVENALVAYSRERERRDALVHAVDAGQRALSIANARYTEGVDDFLNVLAAQRVVYTSQDSLASSEQALANDLVALYKALGGGWEPDEAAGPTP